MSERRTLANDFVGKTDARLRSKKELWTQYTEGKGRLHPLLRKRKKYFEGGYDELLNRALDGEDKNAKSRARVCVDTEGRPGHLSSAGKGRLS